MRHPVWVVLVHDQSVCMGVVLYRSVKGVWFAISASVVPILAIANLSMSPVDVAPH